MKESDSSLSNSLNINPDIIEKQNLIKSNIIDKNYDKNLFFSFCMNKQGSKGDDLSNWTIEELKEAINNFIKEQNDKVILQNLKENENKNIENTINLDIENIPIPKKENNNIPQNIQEIKCKLLEKSVLNDKDIKIIIRNPIQVETSCFSSNYIYMKFIQKLIQIQIGLFKEDILIIFG